MSNNSNRQIGNNNVNIQGLEEDLGIISEIYSTILEKDKKNLEITDSRDFVEIEEKIKINIKGENERSKMKRLFEGIYNYIGMIEKTFSDLDSSKQRIITIDVMEQYRLAMKEYDNISRALDKMIEHYTPKHKSKNPEYNILSRAFVLFFFDDCTIGEKN